MIAERGAAFRIGVNYWPARTAMGWWTSFQEAEVRRDFERMAACGFDSVRIFLTWEDFQPEPHVVDTDAVNRCVLVHELAAELGLVLMPTLFTGHMSGVNWIPGWALGNAAGDRRFRVFSDGRIVDSGLASWYSDERVVRAQEMLARELASALAGHDALLAWDLGNENSNCSVPPDKGSGRDWLRTMTDAIRGADPTAAVTIGLHMEDLEHDRNLGPAQAAEVCDFLTMHGYPGYARWSAGATDERVLAFLTRITSCLGGGAPVLFSEFGVPTCAIDHPPSSNPSAAPELVTESAAAGYTARALRALHSCGSTGAMLWCHSDYPEDLWSRPPLELAPHERSFGLWRSNGSEKPSVAAVRAFAADIPTLPEPEPLADSSWLDLDAERFYSAPETELPRLYRRYCEAAGIDAAAD